MSIETAWHLVCQYVKAPNQPSGPAVEAMRSLEGQLGNITSIPDGILQHIQEAAGKGFLVLSPDGNSLYYRDRKAMGPYIVFTIDDVVMALYDTIVAYQLPPTPHRLLLFLLRREHQRISKEIRDLVEERLGKWEFD